MNPDSLNKSSMKDLSEDSLDAVCGGNSIDRAAVLNALRDNGYGDYLITGKNDADTLSRTCKKYNIKYKANACGFDTFEFDGHKFSSYDLNNTRNRKLLEDYIAGQL